MKKVPSSTYPQSDYVHDGWTMVRHFLTACSAGITVLCVIMLQIPSAWAAAPASPAPGSSGYEIPLVELNKVKKERPQKKETKERKKKKSESTAKRSSANVAATPEKVDQPVTTLPGAASTVVSSESQQQTKSSADVSSNPGVSQTAATVTVHHDPYSYVITGKRTVIQAVIGSVNNIQSVQCRFRTTENGAYALVPMVLAPGTLFTYTTTLPSLAKESQALRYSIIALDSVGHEARSQEFVVAVKSSAVLPGWQSESSTEPIKIRLENREKPLEGFSDPVVVE